MVNFINNTRWKIYYFLKSMNPLFVVNCSTGNGIKCWNNGKSRMKDPEWVHNYETYFFFYNLINMTCFFQWQIQNPIPFSRRQTMEPMTLFFQLITWNKQFILLGLMIPQLNLSVQSVMYTLFSCQVFYVSMIPIRFPYNIHRFVRYTQVWQISQGLRIMVQTCLIVYGSLALKYVRVFFPWYK